MVSIKAGADVNALDTREKVAGPNGRRALNYAALRNDTAMITALLDAGAAINLANRSGFTPLYHAGEAGSKEAATLLIATAIDRSINRKANSSERQVRT
jgi:ankyrin repeat protein